MHGGAQADNSRKRLRRRPASSALTVTSRKKASTGPRRIAKRAHRALEIFARQGRAGLGLRGIERRAQRLFLRQSEQGRIVSGGERALAVLLLLGLENVGGAAIAGEQVLAVLGVEEFAERLDAADDEEEVVLAGQREHGVDQVVPRAAVAQVDF